MGYDIHLSDTLIAHPALLAQLKLLFQENDAGEDIQVVEAPALFLGIKTVELDDDSGSYRISMVWLDAAEFDAHIRKNSLSRFIENFRDRYGQDSESHKTLLLLHGLEHSAISKREIDVEMFWREIQYPCLHRTVDSVQDAACVIHSYMHGLLKSIAHPSAREIFEAYYRMLLVIPGMNPERVELVMQCYRTMRSLWKALKALKPEIEAGCVQLNASLFTDGSTPSASMDKWVWNLYHQLTSEDPEQVFFSEQESL
ncbi:hypothetical protein V5O48_018220 [Marasmius crinis-equi]|uniref:ABM domain-containing protein n=1 Tax=Marasmius crinis-equi TaxID=585013 RepID=A0ABR3ELT4_9AGAR